MELIIHNMAPIMFAALVIFLLLGYPVAFALAANGIFFGLVGIELGLLQPSLFLHFSLTFPETKPFVARRRWLIPAVYVPAVALLAFHIFAWRWMPPSEMLRWNLDRGQSLRDGAAAAVGIHGLEPAGGQRQRERHEGRPN